MSDEESEEAKFAGPKKEAPFFQALFCPCGRDYISDDEEMEKKNEHLAHMVEEHHEQPNVLWFSFFSDLIYVCVIIKFTEQYKHFVEDEEIHPDAHTWHWFEFRLTLELLLYFLAFFTIWLELVQIKARFYDLPGLWDDAIQFIFLVGIIWMAVQMDADSYLLDNKEGFVIGFSVCTFAMFILHLLYYSAIGNSRNYVTRRLIGYGLVLPLLGGLICVDQFMDLSQDMMEWLTIAVVIGSSLILLSIAFVSFRVMSDYNYTADFFAMRFGILTMIIIGESMLACIIGDKTFGFLKSGSTAASAAATAVHKTATTVATTVVSTVVEAVTNTTDNTLAPDGVITPDNVLQHLKDAEVPEVALASGWLDSVAEIALGAHDAHESTDHAAGGSYLLNKYHYYIYDQRGAFFQNGGMANIEDYVGIFLAFGTLYILKNIYFGSHGKIAKEALRNEESPGSVWWIAVHVPMYFFLLTTGAGFRLIFTVIHDEKVYEGYAVLLVASVAMAITCILMLRLARPPENHYMKMWELTLRLATVFILSALVLVFLDEEPIPLMGCVFIITALSWIYDLVFPPIVEDSHHGDDYSDDDITENHNDCWRSFLQICGLGECCGVEEDKEYEGNFSGPKYEGHIISLLEDVVCCNLCDGPAPVPEHFSAQYTEEITKEHHHGHEGHGHGHADEEGADHGMFGEFTDLIYVAIVIKFADQMKYKQFTPYQADEDLVNSTDDRFRIYIEAAIFFMCFFYTWLELTHCLLRFKNMPGIFDDIMFFFYLSGVVGMAVNLNHLEFLTERRLAFCSWFSFALASLTVLHLFYMQINDAEGYVKRRIPWFAFAAIGSLVAGFLPVEYCLVVMVVSVLLPMLVSVNSYRVWEDQKHDKHHQFHYVERFGLIIMICIGESVLALVLVDFERKYEFYAVILTAFTTMFVILQSYIRSDSHAQAHALAEGEICGSILWVCFHGIAAYFLLGMGVGYKMILPYADLDHIGEVARFTLCYSLFGVLFCFIMIRAAHNLFQLTVVSFVTRIFVAGSAIVASHFLDSPIYITLVCLGVVVVSFGLDFIFIDWLKMEVDEIVWDKLQGKKSEHEHLLKTHSSEKSTS